MGRQSFLLQSSASQHCSWGVEGEVWSGRGRVSRFINTVGLYRGQNRIGDASWNEVARVNQRLEGLSTLDRLVIDPHRNRVVAECFSLTASDPLSQNVIGGVQYCHEHPN